MTSERLSVERVRASIANGIKVEGDKHGYFIDDVEDALDELDACHAELAAATAWEARLLETLGEIRAVCDGSYPPASVKWIASRCDALLAEPDTTSGEEA